MVPKHTVLDRAGRAADKSQANSAPALPIGQAVQRHGALDGRRHAAPTVLIQIRNQFLASASDGLVILGPKNEAWAFSNRRSAWAFLGCESVPIELLKQARLLVAAEFVITPEIAA